MNNYKDILTSVAQAVKELAAQRNVTFPSPKQIRREAEKHGTRTKFGNYNFCTSVRSRSDTLRNERIAWLEKFPKLENKIKNIFK